MTIFACTESFTLADLPIHPLTLVSANDVLIENHELYATGIYRYVDPVFIRWMTDTLEAVRKTGKKVTRMEDFLRDCVETSGFTASPNPVPANYRKPISLSTIPQEWRESSNPMAERNSDSGFETNVSHPKRHVDLQIKCPHLFPMVRGPGIAARYVRSRDGDIPLIPKGMTEYHSVGGNWFPIQDHWICQDGTEPKEPCGVWENPHGESIESQVPREQRNEPTASAVPSAPTPAANTSPLDDLFS